MTFSLPACGATLLELEKLYPVLDGLAAAFEARAKNFTTS